MTGKSKNKTLIAIIVLGVLISVFLGHRYMVYLFELPARSSAERETTTQPVPFDAERREQVRDFVADEIDRQTGRSLQQFNALASSIITAVAILIAVAVAIFGLSWWRQTREHDKIIKEAEEYRTAIKQTAETVEQDETKIKTYLQQAKEVLTKAQELLKKAEEASVKSEEAARSSEASSRFTQALTYQNEGELDKAIEEYGKSIAARESSEAYNNRGFVWDEKGEFDKAFADYNKAIELDPKNAAAYNNRGAAWAEKEEVDKAIADYTKAIELDPKYAAAYSNRGAAWAKKGELDKAIEDFNKAIELDPKYAAAYSNRGAAWAKKGELDKAIEDFNKAIELDPKYAAAYSNRGAAWANKGELDKAIEDYNRGIELDPKYASPYLDAAEALITLEQDFPGAVEWLNQGRGRDAFESDRYRLIASCLEGIALALNGDDASATEAEAKRLLAGGAKAGKWGTKPMDRFLKGLKPEDFADGALETARRIQEMLKN